MPQRRKGFTLIELLVVVAIIALLVSILMPSLRTAKELAKRVQCGANQHTLVLGLATYASEYNTQAPPIWNAIDPYEIWFPGESWTFGALMQPNGLGYLLQFKQVGDLHSFYCPGEKVYTYEKYASQWHSARLGVWDVCPTSYQYRWGIQDGTAFTKPIGGKPTSKPTYVGVNGSGDYPTGAPLNDGKLVREAMYVAFFDNMCWVPSAHGSIGGMSQGRNIAYLDGHVVFHPDIAAYNQFFDFNTTSGRQIMWNYIRNLDQQ